MQSRQVFSSNRVIFYHRSKRNNRALKWYSEQSFVWSLPIRQEILNVSQIGLAFNGICISRPDCNNSANVPSFTLLTALSAIPCVSDLCGTMIPGKIFTCFAKFQGIVRVNDFRLPIRLQELLQAPLCFLWSFCLHGYDWIHWVAKSCTTTANRWWVSRFSTFTESFVICCNQVTKIFCTRYDSANTSSARGPLWFWSSGRSRNFGLLGSEYKHCVYPNPHFS